MKQNNASKLPEDKTQLLWDFLNEIALTQTELNELDKAFERFHDDVLALFLRLQVIEVIKGGQADTAIDEQIKRIFEQMNSGIVKLDEVRVLIKHRWELINILSDRLRAFIESLPPKDHLVVEALQRLKKTEADLRKYAKKIKHQEHVVADHLRRVREYSPETVQSDLVADSNYPNETVQIFLCHSSRDKPLIRKLYNDLYKAGFKPWLDEIDILPGQDWELEIRHAIEKANFFLACLSQNAVDAKGYVHKEIKIALDILDKVPEGRIYLIPVRLENCRVPDRLSSRQWVDLFVTNGFERLIKALRAH